MKYLLDSNLKVTARGADLEGELIFDPEAKHTNGNSWKPSSNA